MILSYFCCGRQNVADEDFQLGEVQAPLDGKFSCQICFVFFLIKVFCVFSQERHWKVPVINFHFVQVNQHAIVQSMGNATIQLQPKALGEQLVLQCMFFFHFLFSTKSSKFLLKCKVNFFYTIFDFILLGNVCYLQGKSFIFFYAATESYMLF